MTDAAATPRDGDPGGTGDRFWLEYPNDDFPYYQGVPIRLSGWQWLFVMAMVVVGFGAAIAPNPIGGRLGPFVPAILFPGIPLAALALVAPRHWTAIFRRVRGRDVLWMIVFAALNLVATLVIGFLVMQSFGASSNRVIAGLKDQATPDLVVTFLRTIPHLFGEEVLTILPFLGLLALFAARPLLSRKAMVVLAWLLSALLFGAAHLPTYGWNLVQCFVVIGSARLILSLAYIKTKNIWVSTGAHILNDWAFFTLSILGAALQG